MTAKEYLFEHLVNGTGKDEAGTRRYCSVASKQLEISYSTSGLIHAASINGISPNC
jgi:hypothetical protein